MMARRDKEQAVDRTFALTRLDDARAYLQQAEFTLELADASRRNAAAASSAIQAGIAAADAACGLSMGVVSRGNHTSASTLLAQVPAARAVSTKLQRLVQMKSAVQYLATPVTDVQVRNAIVNARAILTFAESLT